MLFFLIFLSFSQPLFMFPFCYPYTGYSQRQRQAPGQRRTRRHTGNEKTRRHTNHEKGHYSPQDSPFARSSVSIYCKPKGNKQQYHICVHQITCLSPCLLYCPAYLSSNSFLLTLQDNALYRIFLIITRSSSKKVRRETPYGAYVFVMFIF